jgi:hypothetical protein
MNRNGSFVVCSLSFPPKHGKKTGVHQVSDWCSRASSHI